MIGHNSSILALCSAARGLIEIIRDPDIDLEESDRNALLPTLRKISEKIRSEPARSVHDVAAKLHFVAESLDELDTLDDELAATLRDACDYLERHHAARKESTEKLSDTHLSPSRPIGIKESEWALPSR
jgi:hypothetical protein